jgi:hypothetical protein
MQVKRKSKSRKISLKTIMVFVGIMFVAYLPISSFMFFLKNDAFGGYFPSKFFISEALHSNDFPWWNPYINFGLPQYGDMNSGFYSPFTWFFAAFFTYNAYTFTAELLLYLILAGIGMYQLCRSFKFTKTVSYIAGFSFMCSGYMVGHLQHFNWISGAAFLPWCLWGYNQLINNFSLKNNIVCALIFYLFLSSAHPGMIIGAIYFFAAYIIFFFLNKKKEEQQSFRAKSFIKKNAWMIGLLLLLSIGMMVGYSDIVPFITRGKKIDNLDAIVNPFNLQSLISLLTPMATMKADDFFKTDISMRNFYFGITLLMFFIFALKQQKNNFQKFFLFAGIFFLLLSLGGITKYIFYNTLPLIGFVRLPGEFMVFVILCFILFAAFSLNKFIIEKSSPEEFHFKVFNWTKLILLAFLAIGIIGIIITQKSIIFNGLGIFSFPGITGKLKFIVDHISIFDALILQGFIQLGFLNSVRTHVKRRTYKELIKVCAVEMIVITLFNVPFTGAGQASVSEVQAALHKSPAGIPNPYDLPVYRNSHDETQNYTKVLGNWSFYNKQIGSEVKADYPIELNTSRIVFKDSISVFSYKPYLFCTNDSLIEKLKVNSFKSSMIDITVYTKDADTLVYQQNIYPYWNCIINGENVKPIAYGGVFNAVKLSPGKNNIKFFFVSKPIETSFTISKYIMLLCLLYLAIMFIRRSSPL